MIIRLARRRLDGAAADSHGLNWPDIALLIILIFLPCLFFWRLISPNPTDRLQIAAGDFTEQYFPLRAFTAQEWVKGRLPLWNPYLFGGQPALADIQSGALYPPHVLQALILGWGGPLLGQEIGFPLWALEHQVIFHFSLAAVGTYLFVRCLGRQTGGTRRQARFAGVVAALVFTYSGYLTGFPVQQLTILESGAWLPWILWGLSVAGSSRLAPAVRRSSDPTGPRTAYRVPRLMSSLHAVAWSALALAMAISAGHPQTVLYIVYLTLAYALFIALEESLRLQLSRPDSQSISDTSFVLPKFAHPSIRSTANSLTYSLGLWLFTVILGSTIAAAQILPTMEFIGRSLRAELAYETVSTGLPLNEVISVLYPGFFGGSPAYVGIVSLVLIAAALAVGWPRPNDAANRGGKLRNPSSFLHRRIPAAQLLFWTLTGLLSLILAFGGSTFLFSLFYLFAPGFDAVRQQERVFLIYSFSAAILAGYGAMILVSPLPKVRRLRYVRFEQRLRWVAGLAFALTAIFIYGSAATTARGDEVNLFFGVLWHHLFGLIVLGGILVWLGLRPQRWLRRTWGMALIALWLAFNSFTVNWRFNLETPPDHAIFWPNGIIRFLQTHLTDSPGRIASGGRLLGGNSAAAVFNLQDITGNTPLQLASVDTFIRQLPSWRMWQLMNVRYVVDTRDLHGDGLTLVSEEDELKIFEIGDPLSRAWLVPDVEVIARDDEAIARLAADDFDLRRSAVVAEPLEVTLADTSNATVMVRDFKPTELVLQVEATGNHLLVLSQIYYPGWLAQIDGQPAQIRRVNVVQQGLVVPRGNHTVALKFFPNSFLWGSIISSGGLLAWLLIVLGYIVVK